MVYEPTKTIENRAFGYVVKDTSIVKKDNRTFGLINLPKFYIDFDDYSERNAATDVAKEVERLKQAGAEGLILDLRDNGGGSLKTVVEMAGLFIKDGPIVQVKSSGQRKEIHEDKDERIQWDGPLVILVNESTASASEIVSGAVQDWDRGAIVGRRTFGKGLVQRPIPLTDGSKVRITTQRYYTPSGRCIQLKDYSSRNANGSAGIVADSLRESFKTKNGRVVKDGGGVMPDVVVEKEGHSAFVKQVMKENLFFDFANLYRNKNGRNHKGKYKYAVLGH